MTLQDILLFSNTFLILTGMYQLFWCWFSKKKYNELKHENESKSEFYKRFYGGVYENIHYKWFIFILNCKLYERIRKLFGILLIILCVTVYAGMIWLHFSPYAYYLKIEL